MIGFEAVGSDTAVEVIVGRGILFGKVGDDGSEGCVRVLFGHGGRLLVQIWMVEAHEQYEERERVCVSRDAWRREMLQQKTRARVMTPGSPRRRS